jgi:hypothetical protein
MNKSIIQSFQNNPARKKIIFSVRVIAFLLTIVDTALVEDSLKQHVSYSPTTSLYYRQKYRENKTIIHVLSKSHSWTMIVQNSTGKHINALYRTHPLKICLKHALHYQESV